MESETTYLQAEKKVKRIKNFYNHLQIFVIMMVVLAVFSNTIFNFFENNIHNTGTLKWVRTNIWVNSLLWALGVLIHGLYVFKSKITFLNDWENKKVKEFMNEKKQEDGKE